MNRAGFGDGISNTKSSRGSPEPLGGKEWGSCLWAVGHRSGVESEDMHPHI